MFNFSDTIKCSGYNMSFKWSGWEDNLQQQKWGHKFCTKKIDRVGILCCKIYVFCQIEEKIEYAGNQMYLHIVKYGEQFFIKIIDPRIPIIYIWSHLRAIDCKVDRTIDSEEKVRCGHKDL